MLKHVHNALSQTCVTKCNNSILEIYKQQQSVTTDPPIPGEI